MTTKYPLARGVNPLPGGHAEMGPRGFGGWDRGDSVGCPGRPVPGPVGRGAGVPVARAPGGPGRRRASPRSVGPAPFPPVGARGGRGGRGRGGRGPSRAGAPRPPSGPPGPGGREAGGLRCAPLSPSRPGPARARAPAGQPGWTHGRRPRRRGAPPGAAAPPTRPPAGGGVPPAPPRGGRGGSRARVGRAWRVGRPVSGILLRLHASILAT